MSTLYSKIQGQYVPTFMYMILNLDFEKMSYLEVLHSEVFHHEFIHYLQDLSTTHGMMNSISNISVLQSKAFTAQVSTPSIALPITNKLGTSGYNDDLMKVINGDSSEVWSHMSLKLTEDYDQRNDINLIKLEYYNSKKKERETYRFGALAIRETMAHHAERRLHKGKSVADFPYSTGYYVANEIYGAIANDDMSLLAVCDASLMSCNPGLTFVEVIKEMVRNDFNPVCYKKTYDYCEKFITRRYGKTSLQLYATNATIALQAFRQYFGSDGVFDREYEFICNSIRRAYSFKILNPHYILDLLATPLSCNNIDCLIKRTRLPVMYDNNDQCHIDGRYPTSEELDYNIFRTMYELDQFFDDKGETGSPVEYGCWLYFFCTEHKDKYLDKDICWAEPWEQANKDYLCSFAKLWHRWGLTGKKVIYHNPGVE